MGYVQIQVGRTGVIQRTLYSTAADERSLLELYAHLARIIDVLDREARRRGSEGTDVHQRVTRD